MAQSLADGDEGALEHYITCIIILYPAPIGYTSRRALLAAHLSRDRSSFAPDRIRIDAHACGFGTGAKSAERHLGYHQQMGLSVYRAGRRVR